MFLVIDLFLKSVNLNYHVGDNSLSIGNSCFCAMDTKFFTLRYALFIPPPCEHVDDNISEEEQKMFDHPEGRAISHYTTLSLKFYFEERGVSFPNGATIAYDRRASKLVVKNTYENLKTLNILLRSLDLEQPQVSVESTIVEISDKDLIELLGRQSANSAILSEIEIKKL